MAPPKGRDVGQKLGLNGQAGESPLSDRFAEMGGIPVNDDGGQQVEPGHAVVLALAGTVVNFALTPNLGHEAQLVVSPFRTWICSISSDSV